MNEELVKMNKTIKKSLHEFDDKLMKQRVEASNELQISIKFGREETLKQFR
jgi:hypothetical protein